MLVTVMAELWSDVSRIVGYGLMIIGIATCAWMPLTRFRRLDNKKILAVLVCGLLAAAVIIRLRTSGPASSATAAVPSDTQSTHIDVAPATQPAVSSIWPNSSTSAAAVAAKPAKAPRGQATSDLSDRYTDTANGYSIQFPAGWNNKTFASGDPWNAEVSDERSGMISIGFSPFPSSATVDQLKADRLAARLQSQAHAVVRGHASALVDGHKGLWFRYTAPVETTLGRQTMECVHYYVPLRDGRMLELRLAAPPDKFAAVAALLHKSLATLKLLPL